MDNIIEIGFNADVDASEHTVCFVSLNDSDVMDYIIENINHREFKGNFIKVRRSALDASAIIVNDT